MPDPPESKAKPTTDSTIKTHGISNGGMRQFQQVVAEVEDYAIILLDINGAIASWNKGAEKIEGYSADEIVGRNYSVFYPKEDSENQIPNMLLKHAVENGKSFHEGWQVRKDGNRFWGTVSITALRDEAGSVSGFVKVTRDLTDKKTSDDQLSNFLEELRMKNEQLQKSEERYHKMISEVQDYAIILLDVDGKVLDWNKGAEKLKGYSSEEIVGKSFRLFYPSEAKAAGLPQMLLNEAIRNGHANHEGYRIRKDGSRFWGSVAITAIHNEKGQIIGFSKVTKDLSERKISDDRLAIFTQELKQKNEELRRSEERFQGMISEVQDYAILLLDPTGAILNWNVGAEHIKGYKASEILGKNFSIFYTNEDLEKGVPARLLQEARLHGKAMSEGWRKRKDGSKFWGSIVITALHDTTGTVIGYSKVTRDLTEKKKAEDSLKNYALELELKNHELEKLNADLSSFAYVVSHDLKEPIRKIQIFAGRQLEAGMSSAEAKTYAEKIVTSASRMQKLMAALLSYSQISTESTKLENVDLHDILQAVKIDLELAISETNASIESAKLPVVKGISYQLHQVFLNLLSNSIKFSKENESPHITITAKSISHAELPEQLIVKNKRYHLIEYSDKGIGFEQSQAARIFDVFQRLKPKSDSTGTGIGLAIVKRVIENHDGLVVADGKPGVGATFRIYLPIITQK
jgi:PAS domain S-box-containing protein